MLRPLVNFWYAHPVGHAIEALRYCLGYHLADPELRVSVALNAATPVELAGCCPFVDEAYPVGYTDFLGRAGDPDAALVEVLPDWDYVLDDDRSRQPAQLEFEGVRRYYQAPTATSARASTTGRLGMSRRPIAAWTAPAAASGPAGATGARSRSPSCLRARRPVALSLCGVLAAHPGSAS